MVSLCWHLVREQLQKPELAAGIFPDLQQEQGKERVGTQVAGVSKHEYLWGWKLVKSAGGTLQLLRLYLLLASCKWQNLLGLSTEQVSVNLSHFH